MLLHPHKCIYFKTPVYEFHPLIVECGVFYKPRKNQFKAFEMMGPCAHSFFLLQTLHLKKLLAVMNSYFLSQAFRVQRAMKKD